ncbi:Transcriptional regulator, LacI family [Candidatus Filomicrobium marinum]|uniref:Transcriptional regulator, LacI family n=1 Tax=Candidatus Filomicrobium marinum TaxID=1608628 RepID=A0A0D6JEQ4_9HYPH|nr:MULTISPECIES: LacI family DNA-binding transcriptional regulator [Filomicrobium]MCV0368012.1 LacI family DNA-binding transcriptional regulator [Filomicrobium sp.]CFX16306.1 Transcriptional regulator, LacI family [Candidatus Filomicrobium marinum]CPR18080.1 Transcriptional regulator, LacI family [Candidatus Filomicrobium marinum]
MDKASIISVANVAGVSPSTVSRVFNHPHLVRSSTRKAVEQAVQDLGYIRNRAAHAMHGKRSGTIALVVPTVDNTIFSELIQAFSDAVDAEGFTILIASHSYNLELEHSHLRKLLEYRVDGIALVGFDHHDATYKLIAQQKIPAIAIWTYDESSRLPCVGADNRHAGAVAARHLCELGHRDIGLIFAETLDNDRARYRIGGVLEVFSEYGVRQRDMWSATSPYVLDIAKRVCLDVLSARPRPTALLCGNDVIAHAAIYAAQRAGLHIPDDISIMGIGDYAASSAIEPGLSTVRIPANRIGSVAGRLLTAHIADPDSTPLVHNQFDTELVLRASTKAIG